VNLKPLYLLPCLACASPAAALGLGDLDVRSSLGQPLYATVKIIEPGKASSADCFTLQASAQAVAPLPRVQLAIEQQGDQTWLHIRSTQGINDPVVQFTLVSECETRLQRDYVVLLDPPAAEAPPVLATAAPAAPAAEVAARARPGRQAKQTRATPASASARGGAAPRARARTAATPRLVLSGRRLTGASDAALALRLDTSLPDLDRPRAEPLTSTELSDENTALSRKLAHLEAQLVALQERNAELEARSPTGATDAAPVEAPPARTKPADTADRPQWPLYLLLTGLVSGAGGLIFWLRRRSQPRLDLPDDEWDAHPPIPQHPRMPDHDVWAGIEPDQETPRASDAPLEFDATPRESSPRVEPVFGMQIAEDSTEVKDDILDQAEVFMAHGHGELAIHLLQEHLRDAPDESPVPWLLLLDLLHRAGDSAGYVAASAQCRRHFNVNVTTPPVSQDIEVVPGLETYPHLLERLVTVWRSPDIDDFFKELIYDDRGGSRIGFEPGAYRDILLLRAIAQETLPSGA
jgi:Tfp pilus assembly protein FimV